MKYRHYAPSAPMTVVVGPVDKVTEKLQALYDQAKGEGKTVGFFGQRRSRGLVPA